jgi:Subtilase family
MALQSAAVTRRSIRAAIPNAAWVAFSFLAATALAEGAPTQSPDPHRFVAVRLSEPASALLVKAVAESGVPLTLQVKKGSNIGALILQRCGLVDPTYVGILLKKNPRMTAADISSLSKRARIIFPACLKAPQPSKVNVHQGDTLKSLSERHGVEVDWDELVAPARENPCAMDQPVACKTSNRRADRLLMLAQQPKYSNLKEWGSDTDVPATGTSSGPFEDTTSPQFEALLGESHDFVGTYNAHEFIEFNPKVDPNNLKSVRRVVLPSSQPTWSSFQLLPGVSGDQVMAQIRNLAQAVSGQSAPVAVESLTEARLIGRVLSTSGSAACATPAPNTPLFDSNVLAKYLNDFSDRFSSTPTPVTVLVLDTGFDDPALFGAQIPRSYSQKTQGLTDPYTSTAVNAFSGVNFATKENDPRTFAADAEQWHGLGVAGVVLGGSPLEEMRRAMQLPIRLSFGNMERPAEHGVAIDPGSLALALKYARENNIQVINVSMELFQPWSYLDDEMKLADSVLIVAAAGNDGGDVGNPSDKRWPAIFGGDPRNARHGTVVTVGAEDAAHNKAGFSRTGANYVDLLAPGCGVPTYSADTTAGHLTVHKAPLTGTSFSAPLVSFVAALLTADRLKPPAVKSRLLLSVDVRDSLEKNVYSRGTLNVPRALAITEDVVEFKSDRTVHYGHLVNKTPQNAIRICGEDLPITQIAKLAIVEKGTERKAHVWLRGQDPVNNPLGFERRPVCTVQSNDQVSILLNDRDQGGPLSVDLNDLRDYTPSM